MKKLQILMLSHIFAKKFLLVWNRVKCICFLYTYGNQKIFRQVLMVTSFSMAASFLLVSCKQAATNDHSQPILTPTSSLISQPPFPLITTKNVDHLSSIRKWQVYDVNAAAWSLDSQNFAVAGKGNNSDTNFGIYAYNINSSERMWFSKTYVPFSLVYSPDNRTLAVPSLGLNFLDADSGRNIRKIPYQKGCIGNQAIKYDSTGSQIFTLGTDPQYRTTTIYIWDIGADKCFGTLEEQGVAFDFELDHDNRFLTLGLRDIGNDLEQQVHMWNTETKEIICSFKGRFPVAFALDGSMIAAGNLDRQGDVDLWDAKSCQPLDTLHSTTSKGPFSMDFSPDGKLLVVGNSNTFQIWDVANTRLLFESGKLPNAVKILTFSPDGRFILSETDRLTMNDKAIITLWGVTNP